MTVAQSTKDPGLSFLLYCTQPVSLDALACCLTAAPTPDTVSLSQAGPRARAFPSSLDYSKRKAGNSADISPTRAGSHGTSAARKTGKSSTK